MEHYLLIKLALITLAVILLFSVGARNNHSKSSASDAFPPFFSEDKDTANINQGITSDHPV